MRNGKWEEYELDFIKQNYKNMTYQEIAYKLDRTKTAIDLKVNRLGLKKSKYVYDESYFENINCEEKAYWLGFIFADGCVSHSKNEHQESYELSIKLQSGDYNHLKKFNKSIQGNLEVTKFVKKLNGKDCEQCQIRIYSKKMVNDLSLYGVIPNKSKVIEFPSLKNELIPHFVRGFFDGDGCVSRDSKKRKRLGVDFTSGSINFLESLRQELYKNTICSYIYHEKENTYRLFIKGLRNCDNFLKYIYKDSSIYLERKFIKKNTIYQEYDIAQRLLL